MSVGNDVMFLKLQAYKAERRRVVERMAKGRCELKNRHWLILETIWENHFAKMNPQINSAAFRFFSKYHPSVRWGQGQSSS